MSTATRGLSAGQNLSWSTTFWNKVHRYRVLMRKYWWVLVFTLSVAWFAGSYYQISRPPTFLSTATLIIDDENRGVVVSNTADSNNTQLADNFADRQIELIVRQNAIKNLALKQLQAKYPGQATVPVSLTANASNSILTLNATGSNPVYVQRYLQAVVQSYLLSRKQLRRDANGESLENIRDEQLPRAKREVEADDQALIAFQREHNIVFDKQDTTADGLTALYQRLTTLQDQYNQLQLMTPEQGLDRAFGGQAGAGLAGAQPSPGALAASATAEGQFRTAQAELATLRAQRDDFARDLRPAHPKMLSLKAQIDAKEKEIAYLVDYNRRQLEQQRQLVADQIKETQASIAPEKEKALERSLLRAEFNKLQEKKDRDAATYADLQKSLRDATLNTEVKGDSIRMLEAASPAINVPSSWIKILGMTTVFGLGLGIGILLLIDRMDDRMGSIGDFQAHFAEHVLGQIPRDGSTEFTELLKPDDERHQLVESFRNLRSTLLFMPMEGARPKTLLVTSAVPNEGKSTLSSNLALVMAAAGMKTLLIDADLRRGAIHEAFGITRDPGLTDVLGHSVNWKIAIRTTGVENLHVLPRGRNVPQPSEYLLNRNTDRLLQELYPLYDYIIIDSSPVLAADDTASLAPKIDATLFVVRMGFTSAKMTRKSLEILYDRQANIPGLVLNQVDTSSPEFVYYQYSEYYHVATDDDDHDKYSKSKKRPVKPIKPSVEV